MLLHKGECGGNIVVNISKYINFTTSFGVGSNSLTMGMGEIKFVKDGIVTPKFVCTNCEKEVEVMEIDVMCQHCGIVVTVGKREAWKPNSAGGVYCRQCLDTYFESIPYKNLETIMRRLDLGES